MIKEMTVANKNVVTVAFGNKENSLNYKALPLFSNEDIDRVKKICLLYTSDAADDQHCVDLGDRRIIKKKTSKTKKKNHGLSPHTDIHRAD